MKLIFIPLCMAFFGSFSALIKLLLLFCKSLKVADFSKIGDFLNRMNIFLYRLSIVLNADSPKFS